MVDEFLFCGSGILTFNIKYLKVCKILENVILLWARIA
jgi:hypothetical protein